MKRQSVIDSWDLKKRIKILKFMDEKLAFSMSYAEYEEWLEHGAKRTDDAKIYKIATDDALLTDALWTFYDLMTEAAKAGDIELF